MSPSLHSWFSSDKINTVRTKMWHHIDKSALRSYLTPFSASISSVWQKNQLNSLLYVLTNIFRDSREENRPYHRLLCTARRLHINNKFPRGELRTGNLNDCYVIDVNKCPGDRSRYLRRVSELRVSWLRRWKSHQSATTIECVMAEKLLFSAPREMGLLKKITWLCSWRDFTLSFPR